MPKQSPCKAPKKKCDNTELATLQRTTNKYLHEMSVQGSGMHHYANCCRWQLDYTFKGIKGQVTHKGEKDDVEAEKAAHRKFHDRASGLLQ